MKRNCIEAALKIQQLIEKYRNAFTLRRAQYGISYAMYCAVLILIQQTNDECDTYIESIQFFWLALQEYQRGCGHGLKKPLRLLKSLIYRLEKAPRRVTTEKASEIDWSSLSCELFFYSFDKKNSSNTVLELGSEDITWLNNSTEENMNTWGDSFFGSVTNDLSFTDEPIFGFFEQN